MQRYAAVFPAGFFKAVKIHSVSSEADALLILPIGVSGRFSYSNQAYYYVLK
jgi:hypothetical protein